MRRLASVAVGPEAVQSGAWGLEVSEPGALGYQASLLVAWGAGSARVRSVERA